MLIDYCSACFNTQPPEGGWTSILVLCISAYMFQHTAARRRLAAMMVYKTVNSMVSTHSRPKAAGYQRKTRRASPRVSTHSRPKAAGVVAFEEQKKWQQFQHTAARRRLAARKSADCARCLFQHTAARRRLEPLSKALLHQVSQPRFR